MGLSRIAAMCRACPYVSTCDHKRMEALGYLPLPLPEPTVEIQMVTPSASIEQAFDQLSRSIQIPKEILKGGGL